MRQQKWVPGKAVRVLVTMACAATAAVVFATPSIAQQPAPKTQPKSEPKAQPKGAPAPPQQQPQQGQPPQLTYTPWTKICQKEANAKSTCFIGRDGRLESGAPVVAAMLAVPEGAKKVLRVTLPLGMALQPGTRVLVDNGQPVNAPYVICMNNGCMSDYEASEELIGKMKSGQHLIVQGINSAGQQLSLPLPLADFAKAYDGPPTDPKDLQQR